MPASESVLVVDDDPDVVDTLSMVLERFDFPVQTACNGVDALAAVEHEMPRIILLDMLMPIMTGWQFAEEYARRYPGRRAPIVVLTAADDARARAIEIGAADYLRKPFDMRLLLDTVRRVLATSEEAPAHAP
jgi:CheY-like chemotaxis protein